MYRKGDLIKDRYEVFDIKHGGMGLVYLCDDIETGEKVAVKTILPNNQNNSDLISRFKKEISNWILLGKHDNIVEAKDIESIDNNLAIILEYVEPDENGFNTLADYIKNGEISTEQAIKWAIQFCDGMIYAISEFERRDSTFIHRDIKPENIMITHDRILKITDMGTVKTDFATTQLIGTPLYMSPEQVNNKDYLDTRSDIYSFGCVMYEMFCGRLPFDISGAEHPIAILLDRNNEIIDPSNYLDDTLVNNSIRLMLLKCLERDRDDRFNDFNELKSNIEVTELEYLILGNDLNSPKYRLKRSFVGHTKCVNSAVFLMDDKYIASGSNDGTIKLWETETGRLIKTFYGDYSLYLDDNNIERERYGGNCEIAELAFDRNILLVGFKRSDDEDFFKFYNINDIIEMLERLEIYEDNPNDPIFDRFASISLDVNEWRREIDIAMIGDSPLGDSPLELHERSVYCVAWHPSGDYALTGGVDNTIKKYNIGLSLAIDEAFGCIKNYEGHNNSVWSLAFTPDGESFVSGSYDGTVKLWDFEAGDVIRTFRDFDQEAVYSVAISPDGKYILSAGWDKKIRLWKLKTGKLVKVLKGHRKVIRSVAFSPDGKLCVSGSQDKTIRIWDIEEGCVKQILEAHDNTINQVSFSSDGKYILSAGYDNIIKLWKKED